MKNKNLKILISGGGTGGHIFPAVSIANEIKRREPSAEILFVGAEGRMEMEKVPKAGYEIIGLTVQGFQRKLTLKNLSFLPKLLKSLSKAKKIVGDFKPDIAIGTGGFASGPVVYAATKYKVPVLIQEQNSLPGVTNKILSKKANVICVAYEEAKKYFPPEKVVLTGNPIRKEITEIDGKREEALNYFGLQPYKPVVLVVGGSLGALAINEAVHAGYEKLTEKGVQLIWQTGKSYFVRVNNVEDLQKRGVVVKDFIYKMDYAYAAADIIVSRAGAMSISELAVIGKPVILVPSPYVAENHQYKNAMALVSKNAAVLVKNDETKEKLVPEILNLTKDEKKRSELGNNIKKFAKPNATQSIVDEVFKLIEKR